MYRSFVALLFGAGDLGVLEYLLKTINHLCANFIKVRFRREGA